MHSSRMRTARLLTVSRSIGGMCLSVQGGGVCQGGLPRGCVCLGVYPSVSLGRHPPPPWTEFLTHACENIVTNKSAGVSEPAGDMFE